MTKEELDRTPIFQDHVSVKFRPDEMEEATVRQAQGRSTSLIQVGRDLETDVAREPGLRPAVVRPSDR